MTQRSNTAMDVLWAPWRMEYILPDADSGGAAGKIPPLSEELFDVAQDPNCFLCQSVVDTTRDAERYILARRDAIVTVLNIFPYNNGHLLVAPQRHVARLDLLTQAERAALAEEVSEWMNTLRRTMNPDGFNVGLNEGHVAGAGLPGHLHWHIVPRWGGDTNFMTSVASSKVIPQSLATLWQMLREKR